MKVIGFFAYSTSPLTILPATRVRALLAEAALQSAELLFFSAGDCNLADGSIEADCWSSGGFVRRVRGIPDVVMVVNRPHDLKQESITAWLSDRTVVVEDRGANKLQLPRLLEGTALARYIIPWQELPAETLKEHLHAWLSRHGSSVVKSADGRRGGGIHFLEKAEAGGWRARKDEVVFQGDLPAVVEYVSRRIEARLRYRPYLIQRYIASRSPDGRAADFRVHVQRDGSGAWGLTRAYVRLAEHGMPTSNVSRGGYQGQVRGFLAHRRRRAAEEIEAEMIRLALDVAMLLEERYSGTLSELGVDVAIDEDDALWLIETNTTPQSSLHELERAVRTIGYALHLADAQKLRADAA